MTDITERLRADSYALPSSGDWIERNGETLPNNSCSQAADEINRLREAVAEQRRAIECLMCGMPEDGTTPVIRRIAALEADAKRLRAGFDAACAFIDCHRADPDLSAEMIAAYAEFNKQRAAMGAKP